MTHLIRLHGPSGYTGQIDDFATLFLSTGPRQKGDVAFDAERFVFSASEKLDNTYISVVNQMPHA